MLKEYLIGTEVCHPLLTSYRPNEDSDCARRSSQAAK